MWGTRFLSAFVKVNPYFTLALAVGFSGVATVGFNRTATEKALSKLIPLHLQSMLSNASSDKIVSDVQGMEQAWQMIRSLSQPESGWSLLPKASFEQVLQFDPLKQLDGGHWQDLALAGLNVPSVDASFPNLPEQPGPDPDKVVSKTTPRADYPDPTPSVRPDHGQAGAEPALFSPHAAPPPAPLPFLVAANVLQPGPVPPAPNGAPPVIVPSGPPPGPLPGPVTGPGTGPGGTSVGVAEPPMVVIFAALLPLLVSLRRRTQKPAEG